jgi:hypothetical protein
VHRISHPAYWLVVLVMCAAILWQLRTGEALGAWWYRRIFREEMPGTYWLILAAEAMMLIAFMVTGRSWHIR